MGFISATALASPAEAESFVRAGNPARALMALDAGDRSPAAQFWRGRALIDLGRLEEASYALESVPAGHPLSPSAQRALIYCAWQCPELDFASLIAPLTESSDLTVSRLATAALAEYELRRANGRSEAALREIQELAAVAPEWELASRLLEIESLRQQRRFDDALTLCRLLESDKSLPTLARQRVRLALSEVFYAMEQHQDELPQPAPAAPIQEEEEQDTHHNSANIEGKGEETLLQFIAANPDSPLLGEAFRRLASHGALEHGEYAAGKLEEWMNDPSKPRRAALALRVRQLMLHRALRSGQQPDATCVNMATSQLPREPLTAQMLREQVRVLMQQERQEEAKLYLRMLPASSPHALFYEGIVNKHSLEDALDAFLGCALVADESLRPAALVNALLAALASGNTEEADRLMAENHPRSSRSALLSARAAYLMPRDADAARRDLEELLSLYPEALPPVDAVLDLAVLELDAAPQRAAERLTSLQNRSRETWTVEQELRYYALLIEAAYRNPAPGATDKALSIVHQATHAACRPEVRAAMELKHASLLSSLGRHGDALMRLERFINLQAGRPEVPRALLMAGHEAAHIGSLESLDRAAGLYARCAELESPYATRARLFRASVLTRIGRRDEARSIIEPLLKQKAQLQPEDVALARSFLADTWSLEGTDEGLARATEVIAEALADNALPESWRFRMRMQHATFCSRGGNHDEALKDYMDILNDIPTLSAAPTQADWYTIYSAGSGAVFQHLQLEQYSEAARLAERIANWRNGSSPSGGPSAARFAEWAAEIRRIHPTER